MREAAAALEISERERRDDSVALGVARLAEAHEAVRGRVIEQHELKLLMALEQVLHREAVTADAALAKARESLQEADLALVDAMSRLRSEVRLTRKKESLAEKGLTAWRRENEARAEAESEDQVAERWIAT
ncbi:hypothetical protein [Bradyrhizobium sp. STM 3557]|uniref:hypothetical protein n=1 Tax=Bradyrhizobium sp. STM 3557 TaxID=578920 RepID=UPI00388D921E